LYTLVHPLKEKEKEKEKEGARMLLGHVALMGLRLRHFNQHISELLFICYLEPLLHLQQAAMTGFWGRLLFASAPLTSYFLLLTSHLSLLTSHLSRPITPALPSPPPLPSTSHLHAPARLWPGSYQYKWAEPGM